MLNYIVLINRNSGTPVYQKTVMDNLPKLEFELLSGLLYAVRKLALELEIGELTTFKTQDRKINRLAIINSISI